MRRHHFGFSLAEVLLAFALIAIALLALVGHSILLVNSTQKHDDHTIAADVARSVLQRLQQQVKLDRPPGRTEQLWLTNSLATPLEEGSLTVGETEYSYRVAVSNVPHASAGTPVGSGAGSGPSARTRLKRVDISVFWWGDAGETEEAPERSGYGRLQVDSSVLMKVTRPLDD